MRTVRTCHIFHVPGGERTWRLGGFVLAASALQVTERSSAPSMAPELVLTIDGAHRMLWPASYRVGRDPEADIVVTDPQVSWTHAVLQAEGDAWFVEDCGSRNGTFVGSDRVDRFQIDGQCTLRLGSADNGLALICAVSSPRPRSYGRTGGPFRPSREDSRSTMVFPVPARVLHIGRADDNDVVVDDLSVSRHHADLRNTGHGFEIIDLGSRNGTFLNGSRVFRAVVTEQDLVGIGPATFRLFGDELREFLDQGDVSLVARDLTVRDGGQVRLDRVSFPIGERSLVAVIGPSGAGKSTLLHALTGLRPATEGTVRYNNRDLYAEYAELRHRIGLVPQDDVIYPKLPPRRFLSYAAELRFPGDTTASERSQRVQEVIDELKLMQITKDQPEPPADRPAEKLSGGQKKRVNIALELLTKPSVLFLDEPTSSLDVELKEDVVDSMRELVSDGRTVVMVTHDLEYLDRCDRVLVLGPGGRMAFYGPSEEGLRHFGQTRWVEVYRAFSTTPERDWAEEFRRSPYYQQYVAAGLTDPAPQAGRGVAEPPPAPRSRLAQLTILCRRSGTLIAANRVFLGMLVLMPIVLGSLVRLCAGSQGLRGPANTRAETTLLMLIIIAAVTGVVSSARGLIEEGDMYRRERMAGLSAGTYLLSKIVVLGLVAVIQAALLILAGLATARLPSHGALPIVPPLAELIVDVAIFSVTSMALGLLISAVAGSQDLALLIGILLAIGQVMLTGAVLPLDSWLAKVLGGLFPARWGFAAVASTVNLNAIQPRGGMTADPFWAQTSPAWVRAIGVQLIMTAIFALIAWWRLIQVSPGRARRPRLGQEGR
jgi:ABC transport system ATP-binding/permease protein